MRQDILGYLLGACLISLVSVCFRARGKDRGEGRGRRGVLIPRSPTAQKERKVVVRHIATEST